MSESEVNILQLPDHILSKILGFVQNHWLVASVCKRFYEVDCLRTQKKLEMLIHYRAIRDKKVRQSILKSKRVSSKMIICATATQKFFTLLKEVISRHGKSVVEIIFLLYTGAITVMDLIELLNLLPNLESLSLDVTVAEGQRSQTRARLELSLPKLRKFKCCNRCDGMLLTKYLAKDSLDTLGVSVDPDKEEEQEAFRYLIKSQQSIKHISGNLTCVKHLGGLQLESLHVDTSFADFFEDHEINFFCNFLKTQTNLKSLKFSEFIDIDGNTFVEICKMKTLEQLEINMCIVPHVLIRNLRNLTNLKVLTVFSEKMPILALSHLRLKFLKKLEVNHSFHMRQKTKKRFEKNFAGVKLKFKLY